MSAAPRCEAPAALRTLVAGWFSFDDAEVTGGDLLAARTVAGWLTDAGVPHLVAVAANFRLAGEVAWQDVEPSTVSQLVFACGPLAGASVEALMARFGHARLHAAGVSVVPGTSRLPATRIVARDDPGGPGGPVAAADLAFAPPVRTVPVVGVVRSHPQPEYGSRQAHTEVHEAIDALLLGTDVAPLPIDTRLHPGEAHLCSTPDQLIAVLRRCDAVVTTRLHGLVLALRAGVPAVAVDPVLGGAKVRAQAAALGWPAVVAAEDVGGPALAEALSWCLGAAAGPAVGRATAGAAASLQETRHRLLSALDSGTTAR